MSKEIIEYIRQWKKKGYEKDLPQECPDFLSRAGLAPSYKAICLAILENDLRLRTISQPGNWRADLKRSREILGINSKAKDGILLGTRISEGQK